MLPNAVNSFVLLSFPVFPFVTLYKLWDDFHLIFLAPEEAHNKGELCGTWYLCLPLSPGEGHHPSAQLQPRLAQLLQMHGQAGRWLLLLSKRQQGGMLSAAAQRWDTGFWRCLLGPHGTENTVNMW